MNGWEFCTSNLSCCCTVIDNMKDLKPVNQLNVTLFRDLSPCMSSGRVKSIFGWVGISVEEVNKL